MVISAGLQYLKPRSLLRWNILKESFVAFSAEASLKFEENLPRFRTFENNPNHHDSSLIGKYYIIPQKVKQTLFYNGGIPKELESQMETFREVGIMIRKPALELIHYLKNVNYLHPAVRFVLYGNTGVGKTSTLIHIVHYGYVNKFLLIHIPWVSIWTKRPKEVVASESRPGRADLPVESALWLQHFKFQNLPLLKELDLKISKTYTWSQRESTEVGQPLMDVIEHGINRGIHASDCIAVLLKEIKLNSSSGKFKTLVVVDGVNGMFSEINIHRFKKPDTTMYGAMDVTIIRAVEKVLKNDWNNAIVITSVDSIIGNRDKTKIYPFTPRALLGKWGFEALDPFIPILVENYSEKETESTLDYYSDRMWISPEASSEKGRTELKFLSGFNPYTLMKYCDSL